MILYFSGTGNSEYVAKRIGKEINDEAVNLFEKIRGRDFSEMNADRPWVMVVPTYAWRIPRIVQEWLENTRLTGSRDIYFVMTCGENIGNAGGYLQKLCNEKKMNYMGCVSITMPENYIALFSTPTREQAMQMIQHAEPDIDRAALAIQRGEMFLQHAAAAKDRILSGLVNSLFYPAFVHARRFYATEACISCGKCGRVCPLGNIRLEEGKPVWANRCTHCMACICRCPCAAIEYGKRTRKMERYTCPKNI